MKRAALRLWDWFVWLLVLPVFLIIAAWSHEPEKEDDK